MRILLATTNPHKIDEITAVFEAAAPGLVELTSLADLGRPIPEPLEDQSTFEANAVLKARHYACATDMLCLADDSGIEVDALGGEPGVRSARFAGISGPREVVDPANNKLLLHRLARVPWSRRTARFVCVMALADPHRLAPVAMARGVVHGHILAEENGADPDAGSGRGMNGFGYDPIFEVDELGQTASELSADQKNSISHRGRAARLIIARLTGLRPFLGGTDI